MIRRCRSKRPLLEKQSSDVVCIERSEFAVEKREHGPARSSYTTHKAKKAYTTASISSQEWREDNGITSKKRSPSSLPAPPPWKMNCTSPPATGMVDEPEISQQEPTNLMSVNENTVSRRPKKKLKKNGEVLITRSGDETTTENTSCHDGGISKQRLDFLDNLFCRFEYTGNKRPQEPLDCVESHVSSANATSSIFGTKPMTKTETCPRKGNMTKAEKMQDCYRRVNTDNMWVPPRSPYALLQEDHSLDPWRVLIICMLLNQTTGHQVRNILERLFVLCPTAEVAVQTSEDAIRTIITSLGMHNKRARAIREMSRQYLEDGWTHVTQLYGVGKYAADAYAIFCVGKPEDIVPDDHMLVKYWKFVVQWRCDPRRIANSVNC